MKYALANSLSSAVSGLDPDARAYIDAVVAAGATVTSTQRNAINAFVKNGKTDGLWSSIKRFYLPIWGAAAPNAIDMISRNSGTFVGTTTYSSSTVAFASGAYFNTNTSFTAQGLTSSSGYIFALVTDWPSTVGAAIGGAGASGNTTSLNRSNATNLRLRYSGFTEGDGQVSATGNAGILGIISGIRAGGDRKVFLRKNSGRSEVATLTSVNFGTIVGSNVFFAGVNNSDNSSIPVTTVCTMGSWGFGLGLTGAQDSAFTAAMEILWETCTGATLP